MTVICGECICGECMGAGEYFDGVECGKAIRERIAGIDGEIEGTDDEERHRFDYDDMVDQKQNP